MNNAPQITSMSCNLYFNALLKSTIWVNISGLPRYFLLIIPMLAAEYPNNSEVGPVNLPILASWGLWTVIYMLFTTSFYWMYLDRNGVTKANFVRAGLWIGLATVCLTWWGIANMGLTSFSFLFVATPLAIAEQIVSAYIVGRSLTRAQNKTVSDRALA